MNSITEEIQIHITELLMVLAIVSTAVLISEWRALVFHFISVY